MTKIAMIAPTTLDDYLSTLFQQQLSDNAIKYERDITETVGIGAFDNDKLVGGVLMTRRYDHLYIARLAIDKAYRGQQLGTKLIDAAEAWARERQVLNITLSTRDYQAVGFYEKCGFKRYGKVVDLPFAGVTTVYFVKRLLD
ncbi:GNAT family N-acetyltransferase [Lactiplantibacillus daowaiensis]|uniref:GNAT family N-acetyltransferase n=1 Tax=Lactiplantibacillus daowaiensis TaxID=2559918 RepID=A0ABW1S3X0_9LACO